MNETIRASDDLTGNSERLTGVLQIDQALSIARETRRAHRRRQPRRTRLVVLRNPDGAAVASAVQAR